MRPWITKTVTELSGVEDDIVIEYTMEMLEDPEKPVSRAQSDIPLVQQGTLMKSSCGT